MSLKVIDNFGGRLTRHVNGDLDSGLAKLGTSFGYDPFISPGNLTWLESATQIDSAGSVITDLIMAGKERVESGISYVYAIGHLGRLYKIQVNDPTTFNPNYDNPVLLATLAINTPTFTRGASIDFYGTTERIYIGHDKGVTQIDLTGANEAFVGNVGTWTQNVPRPVRQFVGKLYFGNGSNIAEIDSTLTVTTYTKLTPGFPNNTQVRDIDNSVDGTYLEMVVSRLALPDITSAVQDTTFISNSESYIFKWNGSDVGYTAFTTFPSFSLNSNTNFGSSQYIFGYNLAGSAVYNPTKQIISNVLAQAPLPNAVGSNGNLIAWMVPESVQGFLRASLFLYGPLDSEVPTGWWRQYQQAAQGTETDVIKVPYSSIVSNLTIGSSSNGYYGGVVGVAKIYFSTIETSASPTTKYKFYKFYPLNLGAGTTVQGVYETQQEFSFRLFRSTVSKKFTVSEMRFYTKPLVAGNSFKIDLIGSNGNPITNGSYTFTVGTNVTAGADRVLYGPNIAPTFSVGVRITNLGSVNWTGYKLEMEYEEFGK